AAGVVRSRSCKDASCKEPGDAKSELRIPMDASRIDEKSSLVESFAVGDGKNVIHVRVPDVERKDLAFEAVLHGTEVVYSGLTGYTRGSEGDRSGDVVQIIDRDQPNAFVVVAEGREDTRICGQAVTPLAPRVLDPRTMQLRGASLHRIDKKARDAAKR